MASATAPRDAVEDVLQEAAIVGWRKRGEFREGTRFDAWMSAIVRNLAARERSRRRFEELETGDSTEPSVVAIDGTVDDDVARALRSLSTEERECVLLHHVLGMTHAEIAETIGSKAGTVASHLHRGRGRMRSLLEPKRATLRAE